MIAALFSGTRIVDAIIVLILLEGLGFVLLRRWQGLGIPTGSLVANLAAGVCLLMAMRVVLQGAPLPWFAVWLALSLVAHLTDLRSRWRDANECGLKRHDLSAPSAPT